MSATVLTLVIGDWSGDGHNATSTIVCESNLTGAEVMQAYLTAVGIVGFDLSAEVACDYGNRILSADKAERLLELGYDKLHDDQFLDYAERADDGSWTLYSDESYLDIYLFFVKLGNGEAQITPIDVDQVAIGGYGLFVNA